MHQSSICGDAEKDRGHLVVLTWPHCKPFPNFLISDQMNTRSTLVDRAHADKRQALLLKQAPLEFARAVYGINDHAGGRTETMAAREVARAQQRQGMPLTEERAEQRARAYLPTPGQEHCPRCWVVYGQKNPLRFRDASEELPETASCHSCGAEYATSSD
ncbi:MULTISPECIES: hypothetical protein [unclassified Variovorax]|uniref:hypothetical protein n=1 Tax=unclassified Variovorax TaxID=663243 RepID=UPI00210E4C6B|nr:MULTISPECIES: hypothetical protein [unclassified Variovorax]